MSVEDYYEEYWASRGPLEDAHRETRLRILHELLPSDRPLRVLDAGAGHGAAVRALVDQGVEATGLEISEGALEIARKLVPDATFVRHSAEELPWPVEDGAFDVVVSFEVIEHLLQPRRLLEGARAALRSGGHLALTTPYHGLLKNLALVALRFDRHFAVEGDHVRFFSDAALRRLLTTSGFQVERVAHFGRFPGLWAGTFVWARSRG